MQAVVLTIHLVVCVCLIGLVLLQRSEGGALGMGGGGSGALMSGRGAADALARMTQMAGGAFLITSLLLTVLSGAASSDSRSVFDLIPHTQSAPAPVTTTTPAPVSPASPDPTQSAAPEAAQTQLAAISTTTTVVPAPTAAAGEHAAPLTASATPARSQPASTQPARTQPAATTTTQQARTQPASATTTASTRPATTRTTTPAASLTLPTSGALTNAAESSDNTASLQPVRRERAGPDQ